MSDPFGFERLRGAAPSTWALALVSVCLRFNARRLSKAGLWYDDWFMLPALVRNKILSPSCQACRPQMKAHTLISFSPRCYALHLSGVRHLTFF